MEGSTVKEQGELIECVCVCVCMCVCVCVCVCVCDGNPICYLKQNQTLWMKKWVFVSDFVNLDSSDVT